MKILKSVRTQAQINAVKHLLIFAALKAMSKNEQKYRKQADQETQASEQSDSENEIDDPLYQLEFQLSNYICNTCNEMVSYSFPLPLDYALPRCLSDRCLLNMINQK